MRWILAFVALAAVAGFFQLDGTEPAAAQCSVLSNHPCNPGGCSVLSGHPCNPYGCSVFGHGPCVPQIQYPIGQDLRLTIVSEGSLKAPAPEKTPPSDQAPPPEKAPPAEGAEVAAGSAATIGTADTAEHKLNSIRDLFDALRACWIPPPEDEARPGMEMSVRLSFKRDGGIIGAPRVTYASHDAPTSARDVYHDAITEALKRCTPMPFTAGLGGALAGRPIMIRFVDNRTS
jgi:hypothetical protein